MNALCNPLRRLWLAGLLGLAVACPSPAEVVRIMPLGDSITAGADGGYRTILFNTLNEAGHTIDFVGSSTLQKDRPQLADSDHEGHGGWRTYNIRNNIARWINDYQPDVIFLHIGTNDISTGANTVEVTRRLWNLLDEIYTASPDVTVYVAGIIRRLDSPDKDQITRQYGRLTSAVVDAWVGAGYDARYVNMYPFIQPEDLADALHPNQRGYNKMGLIWAAVYDGTPTDMPLSMTTPQAGQPVTLTVDGAVPDQEVRFYATTAAFGSTRIDDLNVDLDINHPQYLGSATADALGRATLTTDIAPDMGGQVVRVQAAAHEQTSQVLVKIVRH